MKKINKYVIKIKDETFINFLLAPVNLNLSLEEFHNFNFAMRYVKYIKYVDQKLFFVLKEIIII